MMQPDNRTLACLDRLIGFNTVSRYSNLECIDWARAHMEAHGATTLMDWSGDRTKANMLATFGEGPGGLVLSGHVDVVPVDGQAWTSDPFVASTREGRVYGRGACDMKGFDAVVLGHVPDYPAASLHRPIHVALTYDEEQGCLGIPHLIAAMDRWGVRPGGCIVGEPTSMQLVSTHKGGRVFRCVVRGRAAHSSLTPTAVNAIEYAARIIARIQEIGTRERLHGPREHGFDVPHTTISTNLMTGGNGPNIVPATAEFLFDFRFIPATDPDALFAELAALGAALTAEMQAIAPETGVEFIRVNAIPALPSAQGTNLFETALTMLDDKSVGKVSYGTEAGFFAHAGIPSIVCGPGSIAQAHKADEYVALEQLALCDRFIDDMINHRAG